MRQKVDAKFVLLLLAVAVGVGVVYAYPDLRFIAESGEQYKGIAPIGFRDETVYLGRINAVTKGDFALRSPAIYEHRSDPVIMPGLSEIIEAIFGRILGLDVARLDIAATALLPAVVFILVAVFAYQLSGAKTAAVSSALAVVFGMHLFSRAFLLGAKVFNGSYSLPLWFSRPITPQMHFVFFLLALILIHRSLVDGRKAFIALGGLFLGTLFYVSVFYWVFIFATLAVAIVICFFEREDALTFKRIIPVMAIALVVSVPYWMENMRTMISDTYLLLLYRFNIEYTHRLIIPFPAVSLLAVMILARKTLSAHFGSRAFLFLVSMIVAVILTLNQQVLTGMLFKESHWTTYTGKFAVIIVGILVMTSLMRRAVAKAPATLLLWRACAVAFFALLIAHAAGMQENHLRKHFDENLKLQEMAPVFSWLKAHAAKDMVILPSPNDIRLSELLPVYTNSFVYYSEPFFCLSLISDGETRFRMLASYRLFSFTREEAAAHPYSWDGSVFLTSDTKRAGEFMRSAKKKFASEYDGMRAKDALELAKRYTLNYIIGVRGKDDAALRMLLDKGCEKVYDDPYYWVVKI